MTAPPPPAPRADATEDGSAPGEDRALAEAWVTRRDEAAFRLLYRRHTPVVWPLVLRLVAGDEEAAREAVQETWIRVAEGVGSFRWESALRTWIVAIALNCAREAVREERRGRGIATGATGGPAASPGGRSPGAGAIDLARAIDALPDGYRTVLLLHDLEGYTHEEIAGMLGIEPGTSKSQLHRARRRAREILDGEGGDR